MVVMQMTLIVALVLHVLSGVFWAGTTFALARTGSNQADLFFRPQMGAAAIAVVTGGVLWFYLHHGPLGTPGHLLAIGGAGGHHAGRRRSHLCDRRRHQVHRHRSHAPPD